MISIMLPVYNAGRFLPETMNSVMNQTEQDFELIIVNDGSTDNSEEIIMSNKDPRIRYFKQKNGGEAAARNTALDNVRGEFIVFQDSDDISLPQRLAALKRNFTSPSVGLVHSDMIFIDEKGRPTGYLAGNAIDRHRLLRFFLRAGTPFNNPSMMVRREVLKNFRYDTSLRIGTDTDMVFRTAPHWDNVHVPEPLLLYRRHSANMTNETGYETNFLHVHKFLKRHKLEELFPELDWKNINSRARALALVALFLCRRGMSGDAGEWIQQAVELVKDPDIRYFVQGINRMIHRNFHGALVSFNSIKERDHVVKNYLGELAATLGNQKEAYNYFISALKSSPEYEEPMENLRMIGRSINFNWVEMPLYM